MFYVDSTQQKDKASNKTWNFDIGSTYFGLDT